MINAIEIAIRSDQHMIHTITHFDFDSAGGCLPLLLFATTNLTALVVHC
jgi:hypothetical protein